MPGLFISFEGGDGSGKTTQIKLLENWLNGMWRGKVRQTREPGGTHEAEKIRHLLVTGDEKRWDSTTEALLMTAARRDNVLKIIKPALSAGEAVLTDRFYDSTTVYQGYVGGAAKQLIDTLNDSCLDDIIPDLTILLDIDPIIGLERSGRDGNQETRFENKGIEYHKKVREGYLALAEEYPKRFIVIDAGRNENAIHNDIIKRLEPVIISLRPK